MIQPGLRLPVRPRLSTLQRLSLNLNKIFLPSLYPFR